MATTKQYGKFDDYHCQIYIPTGRMLDVILNGQVHLTQNFCVWEIANKQAIEDIKLVIPQRAWLHLQLIQRLRDKTYNRYRTGMTVSSGYRTESFNKSCGGSKNSAHLNCCATDFINISQDKYAIYRNWWRELCNEVGVVGGINYYKDNRIHVCSYEEKFGNKRFTERDYRK